MAIAVGSDADRVGSGNSSGVILGNSATDSINPGKVGFYGTTPVTQRAAANQAASVVSANSYISVTSNLAAFCAEVAATLTGVGLWKGTA